jgi:hypothetical protein
MSQRRDRGAERDGFERRGGYPSPAVPVSQLPKVPPGPAPGAAESGSPQPGARRPAAVAEREAGPMPETGPKPETGPEPKTGSGAAAGPAAEAAEAAEPAPG